MVDNSKNKKILSVNSLKSLINKNQKDNISKNNKTHKNSKKRRVSSSVKKQRFTSHHEKKIFQYHPKKQKVSNKAGKDLNQKQDLPPEIEKILVELILNIWTIGNAAIDYQKNNQLSFLNELLENYGRILEDNLENNSNIEKGQKIIKNSLRPIESINRYYETLMVKLSKNNFEVKERTGQKYTPGMSLDVLVFESDPNYKFNMITETIKPEIYYKNKLISRAQVVVTLADNKK